MAQKPELHERASSMGPWSWLVSKHVRCTCCGENFNFNLQICKPVYFPLFHPFLQSLFFNTPFLVRLIPFFDPILIIFTLLGCPTVYNHVVCAVKRNYVVSFSFIWEFILFGFITWVLCSSRKHFSSWAPSPWDRICGTGKYICGGRPSGNTVLLPCWHVCFLHVFPHKVLFAS